MLKSYEFQFMKLNMYRYLLLFIICICITFKNQEAMSACAKIAKKSICVCRMTSRLGKMNENT